LQQQQAIREGQQQEPAALNVAVKGEPVMIVTLLIVKKFLLSVGIPGACQGWHFYPNGTVQR
jgi:hypothetical protein